MNSRRPAYLRDKKHPPKARAPEWYTSGVHRSHPESMFHLVETARATGW
jgi:hypothetical protein